MLQHLLNQLTSFYRLAQTNSRQDLAERYSFGDIDTLGKGLTRFVGPAFTVAAVAVLFYIVIGGFRYMTSGGDKNAIEGARNMIVHGIIGALLLIFLFVLTKFILESFHTSVNIIG